MTITIIINQHHHHYHHHLHHHHHHRHHHHHHLHLPGSIHFITFSNRNNFIFFYIHPHIQTSRTKIMTIHFITWLKINRNNHYILALSGNSECNTCTTEVANLSTFSLLQCKNERTERIKKKTFLCKIKCICARHVSTFIEPQYRLRKRRLYRKRLIYGNLLNR